MVMATCPECSCHYTEADGCDFAHWRIPTSEEIQRSWIAAKESGNEAAAEAWSFVMNARRELAHLRGDIAELKARASSAVSYPQGAVVLGG